MPELVWYRSLYWRIGLGFVALLGTLLAAQGTAFLWLTGRMSELLPGRSPIEYSRRIANDLTAALTEKADLDIDKYLNDRFTGTYRAFAVVTKDNRQVVSKRIQPPPNLVRAAFGRLNMELVAAGLPALGPGPGGPGGGGFDRPDGRWGGGPDRQGDGRPGDRGPGDGRGGGGRGGFGRGRGGGPGGPGGQGQTFEFTPVTLNDVPFGVVGVPTEAPQLWATARNLGPVLGIVAAGLLIAGTSIAALLIFRPTRRRLKSLQDAAQAIGAGGSGVRANESGGDEVTMLAHSFNEMAAGLEERTQALVDANESRRQLLADVSHELMTPLAAIRGYVETMTMADVKLTEQTRQRYLGIVADETERLEHIMGDLLDLARLDGGGGSWKRESVSIPALFERVLHRHDPVLRAKGITLERAIAGDVTDVTGDTNRLEQALQNLAANAVRHTPDGGRIKLNADRVGDGIRLTVEDSGPGIPEEHLPRVFDRFYKVDESRTGTPLPSGSGLGLSIVQAIVRRHGGQISASNAPDGGARFEIVLPG